MNLKPNLQTSKWAHLIAQRALAMQHIKEHPKWT